MTSIIIGCLAASTLFFALMWLNRCYRLGEAIEQIESMIADFEEMSEQVYAIKVWAKESDAFNQTLETRYNAIMKESAEICAEREEALTAQINSNQARIDEALRLLRSGACLSLVEEALNEE